MLKRTTNAPALRQNYALTANDMDTTHIPKFNELMMPVFRVLKALGGSGKNDEILNRVIALLNLPDNVVDALHGEQQGMTELAYRIGWAKSYMKKFGILNNSERGVWSITPAYHNVDTIDEKEIVKKYKPASETVPEESAPWRKRVAEILLNMDPFGFERLTQMLLRECAFLDVQVTKKSGDGGIDGIGRLAINGFFSFHVAFQCKRYRGSVGASEVRDFRGSLPANIEKGVMITTGTFSRAARDEASCPGKKQIDLIDGEAFIDKLAESGLGLKPAKAFDVDEEFFLNV